MEDVPHINYLVLLGFSKIIIKTPSLSGELVSSAF